jgi:hypothetical protein
MAGRGNDRDQRTEQKYLASTLEVVVHGESLLDCRVIRIDTLVDRTLRVCRHTRFEEVGLALERNHLHKVEGVGVVVHLFISKSDKQSVCGNGRRKVSFQLLLFLTPLCRTYRQRSGCTGTSTSRSCRSAKRAERRSRTRTRARQPPG